jgi:ice-binding like protein
MKNTTTIPLPKRAERLGLFAGLFLCAALATAMFANAARAATAVGLGTADSFAILAGSGVTNTGPSVINGDLGSAPTPAVTGFGGAPNGTVNGATHQADATAAQAQANLITAYNNAAGQGPANTLATELGGQTLTPGVYDSQSGTFGITGTLTLNAKGNPSAVFIFKTASTLISASASQVKLINGAQPCNLFWKVGSSATLGTTSNFAGNILALESISLNNGVAVNGRLLARNGAVTLIDDTVTRTPCVTGTTGSGEGEGGGGTGGKKGGGNGGKGSGGSGGGGSSKPNVQITGVPSTGGKTGGPGGPGAKPCTGQGFKAKISVHSSTGMRKVEVFVDGKLIKQSTNKRFSAWVGVAGLRSGSNTIQVVAVDRKGRRRVASQSFRRCAVGVTSPNFTG